VFYGVARPAGGKLTGYHRRMITVHRGSILKDGADALVNPVNCDGVMGAGLAVQFRDAFPGYFDAYAAACKAYDLAPGGVHVWDAARPAPGPTWIVSFPTKDRWRSRSKLSDVTMGLGWLRLVIEAGQQMPGLASIAVPALGCGLGGLDWADVRPVIESTLGDIPDVRLHLYPPQG
jgi:O-acetyl-ADP-ribose deacetylase (regulator of RNase III)